jgi:hypothetical protein
MKNYTAFPISSARAHFYPMLNVKRKKIINIVGVSLNIKKQLCAHSEIVQFYVFGKSSDKIIHVQQVLKVKIAHK